MFCWTNSFYRSRTTIIFIIVFKCYIYPFWLNQSFSALLKTSILAFLNVRTALFSCNKMRTSIVFYDNIKTLLFHEIMWENYNFKIYTRKNQQWWLNDRLYSWCYIWLYLLLTRRLMIFLVYKWAFSCSCFHLKAKLLIISWKDWNMNAIFSASLDINISKVAWKIELLNSQYINYWIW